MPKALVDRLTLQGPPRASESGFLNSKFTPHTPAPPPEVSNRLPRKPEYATRAQRQEAAQEFLNRLAFKKEEREYKLGQIIQARAVATIRRLQALFDRKKQLNALHPHY